jgi:hypothetical protein
MFYIRTTKTSSGSIAVQIVRYENRKKIIVTHIGSARTSKEILSLKQTAVVWIEKKSKQSSLLPLKSSSRLISIDKCQYLGVQYLFIYEMISRLFTLFKFHLFKNTLLTDLTIMRIIEPASKLHSLKLLKEYFGIHHSRRDWYRCLPEIVTLKDQVEKKL